MKTPYFSLAFTAVCALALATPPPARGEVLIGNIDAPDAAGGPLIGQNPNPNIPPGILSVSFTTSDQVAAFENLKLRIKQLGNFTTADPFVSLFLDNGNGLPGPLLVRLEEDRPLEEGVFTYTFTTTQEIELEADTRYHVVVSNNNNGAGGAYGWVDSAPRTAPAGDAAFESYRSFNLRTGQWTSPIPPRSKFEVNVLFDDDGDGVPNDLDFCPDSIITSTIIFGDTDTGVTNTVSPDGCSLADRFQDGIANAKNHGQFVSSVAKKCKDLERAGFITKAESKAIKTSAAQSNVGK